MIIGIDPGMNGAICFSDIMTSVEDFPIINMAAKGKTRNRIDIVAVCTMFDNYVVPMKGEETFAFIEKAQSMPGQGVASTFGYGVSYGMLLGVLADRKIKVTEVHPKTWKKVIMKDLNHESKDAARMKAKDIYRDIAHLFDRKKDEHRAEAALIAEYGRRTLGR